MAGPCRRAGLRDKPDTDHSHGSSYITAAVRGIDDGRIYPALLFLSTTKPKQNRVGVCVMMVTSQHCFILNYYALYEYSIIKHISDLILFETF